MNTIRTAALVAALATASASSSARRTARRHPRPQEPPSAHGDPRAAAAEERGVVKDGEFIPTQELSPDEDVTFPVDI